MRRFSVLKFFLGGSKRDSVRTPRTGQRMEGGHEPRITTFQTVVALPFDVVIPGWTVYASTAWVEKKGHNLFFSCDEKPLGSVREKNGAARAAFTMFFIFVSATFKAPGQVPHSLRFAGSSPLRRLRVDARLAPGNSQCSRPLKHDCNISIRCRGGLFCHSLIYSGAFKPTTTYRWHSNQRHSPKKAVFHITTRSW